MRKNSIFLFLFVSVVLYSCSDKVLPTSTDVELETVEEVKQYLSDEKKLSNFITGIEKPIGRNLFYSITFEDGIRVSISRDLVNSIDEDYEHWIAHFSFVNDTFFQAPLLGIDFPVSIEINPSGMAPLTAVLYVEMPVEGRFSVEVHGRNNNGIPISNSYERVAMAHDIPVLGLYPNHDNQVELTFERPNDRAPISDTISISTPGVPISPSVNVVTNTLPAEDDDLYFVSNLKAGFDQRGEIRWIYTGNARYIYRKMDNGNLLMSSSENMVSYHTIGFMEVTMMGNTVRKYDVPNRLHHDVRKMPNGNFLAVSNSNRYEGDGDDGKTEEGVVVEIDANSGEVVREWDFNQILDTDRHRPPGGNPDDLLHINAAYYDETDDSIVISSKHQSTVAKVDYQSGKIIWLLAHPYGWGEQWQQYVLQPVNADGSEVDLTATDFYSYFQHAPMRLPNGNILLYDNGNYRNFYNGPVAPNYSRAVEYKINKSDMTVQQVWEFTYDKQLFTAATGDVDLLENGHRLVGFMWGGNRTPKIVELNNNDEIVFDMEIDPGDGNYYRTEKIDLYRGVQSK
jgi:arylsulfate sulfotransferase